jgi:hypothetical protein
MSLPAIVAIAAGTLIVWASVSSGVAVLLGRAIFRADRQQPPEVVERITGPLPPVPAPRLPAWDDVDEAMFRWFAEGAR